MMDAELLARVMEQVDAQSVMQPDALVGRLRLAFPGVHFSICSDNDIPARLGAATENAFCRLYYVATGEHCLSLTNDVDAATGLVVALRDEDDD